ncbi:hypothetical protein pb186bvf_007898 [Paramecium bursaria]
MVLSLIQQNIYPRNLLLLNFITYLIKCYQSQINAEKKQQKNSQQWTKSEDLLLLQLVFQMGSKWIQISQQFSNRNPSQCCQRWRRISPSEKKRFNWTKEEDEQVIKLHKVLGPKWKDISKHFNNRKYRNVRSRYLNILIPDLNKNPFTEEEDLQIITKYSQIGSRWARIAEGLHKRTDNQVKNRFYSILQPRLLNQNRLLNQKHPYYIKQQDQTQKKIKLIFFNSDLLQDLKGQNEKIYQDSFLS